METPIDQINEIDEIHKAWMEKWPQALNLWSPYTRLRKPVFCLNREEEKKEGLSGSFAMIRLTDLNVLISISGIQSNKLENLGLEILAHEIGHHVYCPSDLTDHARMLARIRRGLPSCEQMTGFVANLYSDLLINDKLKREFNLGMEKVYLKLLTTDCDPVWNFYLRIYEILWSLPKKTLVKIDVDDEMEADAILGNKVIRTFARDWLKGAGRFAALCLTYLLKSNSSKKNRLNSWLDTVSASKGDEMPVGLSEIEEDEISGAVHPAFDEGEQEKKKIAASHGQGTGNFREPFEYLAILKQLGINLSDNDMIINYYKEKALPYLVPFPKKKVPSAKEPMPEGLQTWEIGDSIEKVNWLETILKSPYVVPGISTVEQVYGEIEGSEPSADPIDLDLYVDSSGSIANPCVNISYLTLAGAIISISALRAGSRVQATLWSGPAEFFTTNGFVTNEKSIMEILTGYIGGSTAFPIHMLRETYKSDKPLKRKVHILVISDDGVTTMFDQDEKKKSGKETAKAALERAGGGGTFVLNLYSSWEKDKKLVMASKMGWDIYPVSSWESLIEFSKSFTRKHYYKEQKL